jgi:hypothetical protein
VHAIWDDAKAFYLALVFEPSTMQPMTLMVTLADIRKSFCLRKGLAIGQSKGHLGRYEAVGYLPAFLFQAFEVLQWSHRRSRR